MLCMYASDEIQVRNLKVCVGQTEVRYNILLYCLQYHGVHHLWQSLCVVYVVHCCVSQRCPLNVCHILITVNVCDITEMYG